VDTASVPAMQHLDAAARAHLTARIRTEMAEVGRRPPGDRARMVLLSGAMSDLLHGARDLRQKLHRLEVLLEIEKGGRSRSWFAGKTAQAAERAAAIQRLTESGLIEATAAPAHFRLTPAGRDFLKDVRAKVGAGGALDWTHADEVDFSKL